MSCDVWSTVGGNPQQTGFNAGENVINTSNVAELAQQFIVPGANGQPVFEGDLGFVGVGSTLIAFDRSGVTNCGGSPVVCSPLWSAPLPATVSPTSVAGGVVYATVGSNNGLHAFEAAGQQKCSGTPKICLALWSTAGGSYGSVIAAGGRITGLNFDSRRIESFDAKGTVNCSGDPKVCEPMWRTVDLPMNHVPGGMAISGNRVFQVMQPSLLAFDLAGCTPNPSECAPLWTGPLDGYSSAAPTVVGGRVYVSVTNQAPLETQVRAFDEQGVASCSGTPLVCTSLWADDAAGPPATISGASAAAAYGRNLCPSLCWLRGVRNSELSRDRLRFAVPYSYAARRSISWWRTRLSTQTRPGASPRSMPTECSDVTTSRESASRSGSRRCPFVSAAKPSRRSTVAGCMPERATDCTFPLCPDSSTVAIRPSEAVRAPSTCRIRVTYVRRMPALTPQRLHHPR